MGKYHCTIDLLFDWFGISCMTTDIFCFYSQNRLIQTSQTGGQQYNDTSSLSIPWLNWLYWNEVIKNINKSHPVDGVDDPEQDKELDGAGDGG